LTEMCSGSEAGSYLRLVYFVYHSIPGLVIKKEKELRGCERVRGEPCAERCTLDAVYVYVVSWSEFPLVPSCPRYPHQRRVAERVRDVRVCSNTGIPLW